jgi:hypothetical protein
MRVCSIHAPGYLQHDGFFELRGFDIHDPAVLGRKTEAAN